MSLRPLAKLPVGFVYTLHESASFVAPLRVAPYIATLVALLVGLGLDFVMNKYLDARGAGDAINTIIFGCTAGACLMARLWGPNPFDDFASESSGSKLRRRTYSWLFIFAVATWVTVEARA